MISALVTFQASQPCFDWASFSPVLGLPTAESDDLYEGPNEWDPCRALVKETFAEFLGLPGHKDQVYIDHNATSCLQRVLTCIRSQVNRNDCVLLTADAEFPGIMAMLDEQWHGPIFVVGVASAIATGSECPEQILKDAVDLIWPDVILMSHVTREAGFRFSDETFRAIRATCPEAVIVIDGAQSCGNIYISPQLLEVADFFITSGHKWLMGKQTLGLALVRDEYQNIIIDPAQSYARCRGNGGTGDLDSLRTCIHYLRKLIASKVNDRMLDERNISLTKGLLERYTGDRYLPLAVGWGKDDQDHRTGIVAIRYMSEDSCPVAKLGTSIGVEAWRSLGEGLPSLSGRRYRIERTGSKLRIVDFHVSRDTAGAVCLEGTKVVRLSVHVTHSEKDVREYLLS